jgi:zinc transport system ATP-binding protein
MNAEREIISAAGLEVRYNGSAVLQDINLSVRPLDFIGIVGPNGGGKSTLLKTILGLIKPSAGSLRVLGRAPEDVREGIGYVPQHLETDRDFPIRVRDVVRMGRLSHRRRLRGYAPEDHEAVARALEQVALTEMALRPMGELSGGQRQRVLIARALAVCPQLLLLDEPTASVDSKVVGEVYELLRELNRQITIILVTHDMAAISAHVKTVGCLNRTLHYHGKRELSREMVEETYQCPVDLIAHGVPHRVFAAHEGGEAS